MRIFFREKNESELSFGAYISLENLDSNHVATAKRANNRRMSNISNEKLKSLLSAVAQGDASTFKVFYDETSPRMLAVALTIMRDPDLAEDVLQEAFVQVWHRAGDYHVDRGNVLTWLTTIVRYRAIDMLRKRGRGGSHGNTPSISVSLDDIDFLRRSDTSINNEELGPLASAITGEENLMLRECVDRLSNSQQQSVALAFFRGFTHRELSECLAEPLGTIKSRLRRCLSRLKECLESIGDGNEIRRSTS